VQSPVPSKSARISPARMVLSALPFSGRSILNIVSSPSRQAWINLSSAGLLYFSICMEIILSEYGAG
jgi:hypothetical protein